MNLIDTKIILDEETRIYYGEDKKYRGITRMIRNQLFPNMYGEVPPQVLENAMKRGNRIHAELTMYDVLGTIRSKEVEWYKKVLEEHNLKIHSNEYIVTDWENFASPIDKVGSIAEEIVLVDVKATYKLNIEYVRWQLSIYKYFFELNNPHLKVKRLYVLHVKDGARLVPIDPIPEEIVKELIRCENNGEQFENPLDPKLTKEESKLELKERAEKVEKIMEEKNQLQVVTPEEYGLEEKTANELTVGLKQVLQERELLIEEFETVSKLEISLETIPKFKTLRNKIVKNRTQGINKWHKTGKEYFLRGGQFLDAIRRREVEVNENMEKVLKDGEDYFENQEKERLEKLQSERAKKISPYVEDAEERDYTKFEEDEFKALFEMKKKEHEEKVEAEKKAEEERIKAEKLEEEKRKALEAENAKLKAEAEKAERKEMIRKAKELKEKKEREAKELEEKKKQEEKEAKVKAKHEAELQKERDRIAKIQAEEKAKREKLEAMLKAQKELEEKVKAEAKAKKEAEANKDDTSKVGDLTTDLESLKTKYQFKSEKNKEMYIEVGKQITAIVKFINNN